MHASPLCTNYFCTCVLPRHLCATVCRYVLALVYQMGFQKKCACPLTAHALHMPLRMSLRMPLKGQEGWSKMTQTSGSSLLYRQKPTVTDSGFWRPREELDGDARVHFGGRGVPGAA
jgi:hypothetical protein